MLQLARTVRTRPAEVLYEPLAFDDPEVDVGGMAASSHADGMFRLPAHQRHRVATEAFGRLRAGAEQAGDLSLHATAINGRLMDGAFRAGMSAEGIKQSQWQNQRYWRCICGFSAASIVTLCVLMSYWVVMVSNSVTTSLDHLTYERPGLLIKTVDDATALLHSTAEMSRQFEMMSKEARPALVNITQHSADMLSHAADIAGQPEIRLSLGQNAVRNFG